MSRRVTQAELDAAWSDLNTIPGRLREARAEVGRLEAQLEAAYAIVNQARKESEGGQS
jgi:hypothetical protein